MPIASLGVLFLWIGWLGFNGGSVHGPVPDAAALDPVGRLVLATCLAATGGALGSIVLFGAWRAYKRRGHPFAPYAALSGAMAGMVANSACCDLIAEQSLSLSLLVGVFAATLYTVVNAFVQIGLRVDDPVEAVGVHAGGGIAGLLSVGFLGRDLLPQVVDISALLIWGIVPAAVVVFFLRLTGLLRVTDDEEFTGLTFDNTTAVRGQVPVRIHHLATDVQAQFGDFMQLVTSVPLHIADTVTRSAEQLLHHLQHRRAPSDDETRRLAADLQENVSSIGRASLVVSGALRRLASRHAECLDLTAIAKTIVEEYYRRYASVVAVHLGRCPDRCLVAGDSVLTEEAVRNLVSNSVFSCIAQKERVERTQGSYAGRVEIRIEENGVSVDLCIEDNGEGVPDRVRRYLGQPFKKWRQTMSGGGLGLFFTSYILQSFGGELLCDRVAPNGVGARFRARLGRWRDTMPETKRGGE